MMAKRISLKLNTILDARGITRYQLGEMTGIDYPTIDRYYKNTLQRYDRYILASFCEALNCDISDLLEYVEA